MMGAPSKLSVIHKAAALATTQDEYTIQKIEFFAKTGTKTEQVDLTIVQKLK
jgi:hypothetical protein